tara:strand:- start:1492 stop:2118 length:627 start_codon:yes stop_codon:yes gene_type:complete
MKFFLLIFFQFFIFNLISSEEVLNDQDYYKKGVEHYDNGEFDKSFVVFFNLAKKGDKDSIYNVSNMYFEGIGTTQDYLQSLKYYWLCTLNGNKKCIKKIKTLKEKLDEKEFMFISEEIVKILKKDFEENLNSITAFKLGYWFEKISPEIDLEKSYLWYSVSVSGGVYKAMKLRDRVGEKLDKDKISQIQKEANDIFTKEKYFTRKEKK